MTLISFLYGLPGSGKTTWANSQPNATVIDCDTMRGGYSHEKLAKRIKAYGNSVSEILVDGLFTRQEQIEDAMAAINGMFRRKSFEFRVDFWQRDVRACLLNDSKRPAARQAQTTIRVLARHFRKPSIPNVQVFEHKINHNMEYLGWWDMMGWYREYDNCGRYIRSDTWCLGGQSLDYNGNLNYEYDPEPQPASFKEFDDLMLRLVPNIGFLQYKRLYNETVTTEQKCDDDYYYRGSSGYYQCDLAKLNEFMNEMKLL